MGHKLAISEKKEYFLQPGLSFSMKREQCIPQINAAHQPTQRYVVTSNPRSVLPEVVRCNNSFALNV